MRSEIVAVDWVDDAVVILDQTLIPIEETYRSYKDVDGLIDAIKRLVVRGAPAIGVAGAFGVVVAMDEAKAKGLDSRTRDEMIDAIRDARPTAVNLAWAVERVRRFVPNGRDAVLNEAKRVAEEDRLSGEEMGRLGADWLINRLGERPLTLLTHCNTGSLATTSIGTALGVVRELHRRGGVKEVYADETRPLLQGSRLTAWELKKSKIPYRIQPDGAATMAILSGRIDAALIGADRVAKNGDAANKIGSLAVALASYESWSRVMGGILEFVGIAGFLTNLEKFKASQDNEKMLLEELARTWWSEHGGGALKPKEVLTLFGELEVASLWDAPTPRGQVTKTGKWLSVQKDRIVDIGDTSVQVIRSGRDFYLKEVVEKS